MDAYTVFLAVARTGSLRAAADTVGGTHATVDRHLTALEDSYGVRLFDRTRAGLSLTEVGKALMPIAEKAELSVISARRKVEGLDHEAAGTVRISLPPLLGYDVFCPLFANFSKLNPDIELDVSVTNIMRDMNRHETDVSLRVAHQVDDDVVGRRVLQHALGIFASQDYIDEHLPNAGPMS